MRARNNKKYYEEMIAEEAMKRRQAALGDTGDVEVEAEKDEIHNERKLDEYRKSSDFTSYERLCRGEETHVSPSMHWKYVISCGPVVFYILLLNVQFVKVKYDKKIPMD